MAAAPRAEQLALEGAAEPKLSAAQRLILDALRQAGAAGLHADECGALAHSRAEGRSRHGAEERCLYCGQRGMQLLRALRSKGLARYRRGSAQAPGYWQACSYERERPRGMLPDSEPLPF